MCTSRVNMFFSQSIEPLSSLFQCCEYNNLSCPADRVFGPAMTTRRVYDVAAHHVVSGAMQGISGKLLSTFL